MYYNALIAEWKNHQGTIDEKLTAINALTIAGPSKLVPIAEMMSYLRSNGLWLPIKAAAGSNPAAAACVDIAEDLRATTIDFTLPLVQQLRDALVSSKLLAQADADALTALSKSTIPWSEVNGYSTPISMSDVVNAGLS